MKIPRSSVAALPGAPAVRGKGPEARELAVQARESGNADKPGKALMHHVEEGTCERFVRAAAVKRGAESKGRTRR